MAWLHRGRNSKYFSNPLHPSLRRANTGASPGLQAPTLGKVTDAAYRKDRQMEPVAVKPALAPVIHA